MSTSAPTSVWLDGRLVPKAEARIPVDDRGLQFGESLYEVTAVTKGKPRGLAEHAERMRGGAKLLGLDRGAPTLAEWERIADELLNADPIGEGLLYAQLTGGAAPRLHVPEVTPEPTFFAYLRSFRFPRAAEARAGVDVITLDDTRWAGCDLKTTMLLPAVLAKREAARRGAKEALFVGSDGGVREGASSNLFLVEGRRLVTPRQSRHLLPGITRSFVARLVQGANLELVDDTVPRERLLSADEVFITSTSALVMPVVHIDGDPVGSGESGPVANDLAARLRRDLELD